jgi:hypothetical protein
MANNELMNISFKSWRREFQSSIARRIKLRNRLPPLARNDLFGIVFQRCEPLGNWHNEFMHVTVKTKSESSRVERIGPSGPSFSGDAGLANGFDAVNLPVNSTSAFRELMVTTETCGRAHRTPDLRRIAASDLMAFRLEHAS